MNKRIGLPLLTLLGGVAGFALRKWQLATAFDEETGLIIGGTGSIALLILLTIGVGVALAVLSPNRLMRGKSGYYEAFCAKDCIVYSMGSMIAIVATLVAALLLVHQSMNTEPLLLTHMILGVASLVTVPFLFLVRRLTMGYAKAKGYVGALLAPAFMACLWLVVSYQNQAANPVVLDYIFGLLAIICLLLGLYQMAGFSFEKPKVWGMCVCSLFGFYLTLVTMADAHDLWEYFLLGAVALHLMVHTIALLDNVHTVRDGTRTKQEN